MRRKTLLIVLFVMNLLVIWTNSALPGRLSHTLSDWVIYGVETAFEPASSSAAPSSAATASSAASSEAAPAPSSQATSSEAASAPSSQAISSEAASAPSSQATSSEAPGHVRGYISDEAGDTLIHSDWTEGLRTLVRKLAHVMEYLTLGFLALLLAQGDLRRWKTLVNVGLSVSLIDETIQIFTKRTSIVMDVWIDMFGFAAGVLLAAGCVRLIRRLRERGKEHVPPAP